jgi:hypothetical protein
MVDANYKPEVEYGLKVVGCKTKKFMQQSFICLSQKNLTSCNKLLETIRGQLANQPKL